MKFDDTREKFESLCFKPTTQRNLKHKAPSVRALVIETLRLLVTLPFLCLNERNISLGHLRSYLVLQRLCNKAVHLAPALMHFGTKSWSKMVVRLRYADLFMEWSRDICVLNAWSTYATYLSMTYSDYYYIEKTI